MEPIIDYLRRQLRAASPKLWPAIAAEVSTGLSECDGISEHFLRKLAYGDRENPGVQKVQPLLDYFQSIDRGERALPHGPVDKAVA